MHRLATATVLQFDLQVLARFNMLSVMGSTYQSYRKHIKLLLKESEIAFRVIAEETQGIIERPLQLGMGLRAGAPGWPGAS